MIEHIEVTIISGKKTEQVQIPVNNIAVIAEDAQGYYTAIKLKNKIGKSDVISARNSLDDISQMIDIPTIQVIQDKHYGRTLIPVDNIASIEQDSNDHYTAINLREAVGQKHAICVNNGFNNIASMIDVPVIYVEQDRFYSDTLIPVDNINSYKYVDYMKSEAGKGYVSIAFKQINNKNKTVCIHGATENQIAEKISVASPTI